MKPRVTPIPIEIEFRRKGVFLMAFVGILFSVILVRLMYMQVIKGEYYTGLSRNNRIRIMGIRAPRGRILDRNGIVLADNRPSYDLIAIPKDITDIGRVATRLSRLIGLNAKETAEKIRKGLRKPYTPVYLDRDITFKKMARVETESYDLPGISIDPSTERDYVYKDLACHVLGFVGEISKKELDAHRGEGDYTIGDLIGKTGIELECEDTLRGKKGKKILEVDAIGRRQKVIEESIPTPGKDVMLTIDKRLQVIASDSL
ncbi:MAG: penicillin-binding protein 2, partial [Deltaproteobacteria bacterium]